MVITVTGAGEPVEITLQPPPSRLLQLYHANKAAAAAGDEYETSMVLVAHLACFDLPNMSASYCGQKGDELVDLGAAVFDHLRRKSWVLGEIVQAAAAAAGAIVEECFGIPTAEVKDRRDFSEPPKGDGD